MTLEMALKEQFQAGKQEGLVEGEAKGREEGLAEGEAKGRKKGLAEGRTEGLNAGYENSIAVLRDLKNGMSVEQIAQKYQIDVEKVQALQRYLL